MGNKHYEKFYQTMKIWILPLSLFLSMIFFYSFLVIKTTFFWKCPAAQTFPISIHFSLNLKKIKITFLIIANQDLKMVEKQP